MKLKRWYTAQYTGLPVKCPTRSFQTPSASHLQRSVHKVVEEMMTILHRVIHFPKPEEIEEVGAGFAHLAGHEASHSAAGATSGFFLLQSHRKVLNNQKAFSSHHSAGHL